MENEANEKITTTGKGSVKKRFLRESEAQRVERFEQTLHNWDKEEGLQKTLQKRKYGPAKLEELKGVLQNLKDTTEQYKQGVKDRMILTSLVNTQKAACKESFKDILNFTKMAFEDNKHAWYQLGLKEKAPRAINAWIKYHVAFADNLLKNPDYLRILQESHDIGEDEIMAARAALKELGITEKDQENMKARIKDYSKARKVALRQLKHADRKLKKTVRILFNKDDQALEMFGIKA
jgi:hypothetical protein